MCNDSNDQSDWIAMEEDLENFHCLLKELRANGLQRQGRYREGRLHSFYSSIATMKSDHLIELSNILFEEFVRQSENLDALLRGPLDGVLVLDLKVQFTREGFILLLRCCLMMLQFLEFDMSLVWEKCGVLFKVLGKLFTQNVASNSYGCSVMSARDSFSQCCSCFLGGINEEADQLLNFYPLILEVILCQLFQ